MKNTTIKYQVSFKTNYPKFMKKFNRLYLKNLINQICKRNKKKIKFVLLILILNKKVVFNFNNKPRKLKINNPTNSPHTTRHILIRPLKQIQISNKRILLTII